MILISAIAQSVTAEILNFDPDANPAFSLCPDYDLATLRDRKIFVMPESKKEDLQTRTRVGDTVRIDIGFFEKLTAKGDAEERLEYIEKMAFHFLGKNCAGAICSAIEFSPIYDVTMLRDRLIFASVIILTMEIIQ